MQSLWRAIEKFLFKFKKHTDWWDLPSFGVSLGEAPPYEHKEIHCNIVTPKN